MELPAIGALQALVADVSGESLHGAPACHGREKADGSLVTALDHRLQRDLQRELAVRWPEYAFLGEEMPADEQQRLLADSRALWILDPLDGTTNFATGLPFYSVSLALLIDGEPRLGVVYDPERGECFAAAAGIGAWLNGERLHTPASDAQLPQAVACIDFKRLPKELAARLVREQPFRSQRNFGSCALEWCWLAAGRFQVYLHGGMKLWDHAAGRLILEQAGGPACDLDGQPIDCRSTRARSVVAATHGALFEQWRVWLAG